MFLSNANEIKTWLDLRGINYYTIHEDSVVDVDGDVDISNQQLKFIPVQFGVVTGDFFCQHNKLTSLKGAPQKVGGNFWCYSNTLGSLKGASQKVGGDFWCNHNELVSLEGAPTYVGGDFECECNRDITSLSGIHKQIKHISGTLKLPDSIESNILGLMLIDGLKKANVITPSKTLVDAVDIINKHLATDRDPMLAQRELMKAGLKEFARY